MERGGWELDQIGAGGEMIGIGWSFRQGGEKTDSVAEGCKQR